MRSDLPRGRRAAGPPGSGALLGCWPTAAINAAAAGLLERQPENEPKPSKALVGFATEEALSEGVASPSKIFSGDGSSLSDCVWSETEASGATKRSGCVSNGIQTPQVVAKSAAKLRIYQTSRIAKFGRYHDDRLRSARASAAADAPGETPAPAARQTPPKEASGHLRAPSGGPCRRPPRSGPTLPSPAGARAGAKGRPRPVPSTARSGAPDEDGREPGAPTVPDRSGAPATRGSVPCSAKVPEIAPDGGPQQSPLLRRSGHTLRRIRRCGHKPNGTGPNHVTTGSGPHPQHALPADSRAPRHRAAARSPGRRGRRTAPDPCPPSELTPRRILEGGGLRDGAWLAGLAGRSRPWSVRQTEPRQVQGT